MTEKKEAKIDDLLKNYPNLKKFDEYYKDEKNLKKLNIFYKKPNVDKESCQIDFNEFDKKYNLNNYSKKVEKDKDNTNNIINKLKVTKKYDFSKLSKDDLNYYLTLVNYYHEKIYGGNIFVKGVNGPIEKALELLKQCQYNTRLALAKILFPVMDRMGGLAEFQNPSSIIPQAMDTRKDLNEKSMEIEEDKNNKQNIKETDVKKNIKINNELVNKQKKLLKNSPSIYLSFALNDLIGADKDQKENWLKYIIAQVKNKVDYKYLKTLIEIANKMKLELPDDINKEINNSETLSLKIKRILEDKEDELNELKDLYGIAKTQKVQTDEFYNLKKIIDQGVLWEQKVNNIIDKCVEYKELESLYNEAKNLPFIIEENLYKEINGRYIGIQNWFEQYSKLLKSSKNKSNNKSNYENKTENLLAYLENMINSANNILKFTSSEVKLLMKNYEYLNNTEKEIKSILYDSNQKITKDMLKQFLSKLNESKFTTELHDEIEDQLNILEWRENFNENTNLNNNILEDSQINKENNITEILENNKKIILKNKVFKFLIKEAETKKLLNYPDVKAFVDNDKVISDWIEKIHPIFYNDKQREKISAKNLLKELHNSSDSLKFEDFIKYYEEGKKFTLMNEECEELLSKCNDIKELYDEIKDSLNDNQSILNFNKLKLLGDRISQYNIICNEFDNVLKQLNSGQEWLENEKKFCIEYNNANKSKFKFHYLKKDINNLNNNENNDNDNGNDMEIDEEIDPQEFIKIRNENIKLIDKYIRENKIFFDELLKLTKNVPSYLKNSAECTNLFNYQYLSELKMNSTNNLTTSDEILFCIEESQGACISKDMIKNYFNLYKMKTWNQAIKYKLYLSHAESLLKEAESLQKIIINEDIDEKINMSDIEQLNIKVNATKDWISRTKQFLTKKEKTFSELINRANEGQGLPLLSGTIDELIDFKNVIENNINEIKKIKNEKTNFEIVAKLYKNFNNNKFIDSEEFIFITSLYEFGMKWTESAKKIINSRQLCQLYFKNKIPLEDGTIIETKENVVDILANQNIDINNKQKDEELIKHEQNVKNIINESVKSHKFILGENQFMDNNLTNFLSKKRSHDNSNNDKENNENNENDDKEEKEEKEDNKIITHEKKNNIKEINNSNNNNMNIDENIKEKDNEENNILNSINSESEFEYHRSEKVKKYYLNQPLHKYECANLLSLINNKDYSLSFQQATQNQSNSKLNYYTRSHSISVNNSKKSDNINNIQNNNNQKSELPEEQQVTQEQIQKFISMDYYHRYMYLRSNLIFHDDTNEKYCICRKGDDSVNYMIICEKCKEWFHGKCLAMPKSVADNISNYFCLCCSRKYDLPKENYHRQFFEIKRVSLNDLVLMIDEGKKAQCFFEEIEILEDIKIRSEIWNKKYYKLLGEVTEYYKKNDVLSEEIEKKLEVLYLESESIQIELSTFLHPITILKHNEWFKGVYKEKYSNKQNEGNIKDLIKSSYWIFNINEKNICIPKLEESYYEIIYQHVELNMEILLELFEIFQKDDIEDNSISVKDKNKRK